MSGFTITNPGGSNPIGEDVTKLIDGTFPDYQRVIPKENLNKLIVSKSEFSKAIDRVSTVSIEKSRAVKLSLINNLLSLNVSSHDLGNASEELEIDYNYDNLEIGFNAKYLLDFWLHRA